MKRPGLPAVCWSGAVAVFSLLGGQYAATAFFGAAPYSWWGCLLGLIAPIVTATYIEDEGFDRGYEAGKRDSAPGMFDTD